MRLLSSELKDIQSVLDSYRITKELYTLRKKRGWVYIDLINLGISFSFHRKRSAKLVGNKFEDRTSYITIANSERQELPHWTEVVETLKSWLNDATSNK